MVTITTAGTSAKSIIRQQSLRHREIRTGYLFILPWIIGFILFTAGPMLASLYLSFTDYNVLKNADPTFIGGRNYSEILSLQMRTLATPEQPADAVLDRGYSELFRISTTVIGAKQADFWIALKVTALFAVISLPLGMIAALTLALLLNTRVPGVRIFRTLIYSPVIVPAVATAIIFRQLLGADQGWLNHALAVIGINGPDWLNRQEWIIPGLVIIGLWGAGGGMLIYLAGLQSIPTELYEAARVDGANLFVQFTRITLPLLTPVLLYDLVLGLIGTFQYFSIPYVLTNGLGTPGKSAFFLNMYLYKSAFGFGEMGYASALAWVLFVIVTAITIIVFRTSGSWVFYNGGRKA